MQMAAANIKDWEESSPKQGQPPECHPIEDKRRGSGRKKQRLRERNSISKRDLSYPRWEVPPLTGRFLLSSSTLCISSPKIKPWMSCTCLPIHFYWLFSCTIHSISSILKMFWLWLITCTVLLTSYLLLRMLLRDSPLSSCTPEDPDHWAISQGCFAVCSLEGWDSISPAKSKLACFLL